MKSRPTILAALAALALAAPAAAAIPPAPKLLPQDTLALFTVPDWSRSVAEVKASPAGAMWADPAMKAFRDNFEAKFSEKILGSLEKDLGVKASDYYALLQGQLTLAVVQDGWQGEPGTEPSWIAVIDAKDHAADLRKQVAEVRKKLVDAKKPVKTEKIRDLEFQSLAIDVPGKADEDADDKDAKDAKPRKMTVLFGQADSALVIGTSAKAIEKVVARITGGTVPVVGEDAGFQASEAAWFRQAYSYGWVNWTPIHAVLAKQAAANAAENPGMDVKAAMKAVGLEGLKNLSFAATLNAEGSGVTVNLAVPEAQRVGLFRMLAPAPKDSGPLGFVPADVTRFFRWRVDGQKLWTTFEQTLANVSPQVAGFVGMMVSTAGKDKDPNFDLRRSIIGNLGDDVVSYSRAPSGKTQAELMSPPTLTLVGSGDAEALANGVRVLGGALSAGTGEELKDREFNGKKVRAVRLPPQPGEKPRKLEFAPGGGYLAIGTAPALLEEYLRAADGGVKSLKDDPAVARAAEKVGGMGSGYFGYENQREGMRGQWEFMRSGGLDQMLDQTTGKSDWREAFDFKALPAFDQVAKYFGIAVYSGTADAQGLSLRMYGPKPR